MLIEAWLQIPLFLCPEGGLINLTPHIHEEQLPKVFSWRAATKIEIYIAAHDNNST